MAAIDGAQTVGSLKILQVKRSRRKLYALAGTLTLLILCVGGYLFLRPDKTSDAAAEVATRLSQLDVEPTAIFPIIDQAVQVRRAIAARDFTTANSILADVLSASQIQNWGFSPFEDFFASIVLNPSPEFDIRLNEWVAGDAKNAIPLLLRAQLSYDKAWAARGHGLAASVTADRQQKFKNYLVSATADAEAAVRLSESNPFGFGLRLTILRSDGMSQEFFQAFADGIAKYPNYYSLYETALTTLQPRWGGSVPAMTAFVDQFAGDAPQSSPLKLLYLSLYRHLLSTAQVNCTAAGDEGDALPICVSRLMGDMAVKVLEPKVIDALQLYDRTDRYQFGLAIKPILSDMLTTSGGDSYSGALLQLAANAMHTDTRLTRETPGNNNYIIDEIVALSWESKGFHANALAKYRQAIISAQSASFPGQSDRNLALADIYGTLSLAAALKSEYVDQIAFQQAAVFLGDPWSADRICNGYYNLKDYGRAIQTCTEAIKATDNPNALYWRGAAYNQSGQDDAALVDLQQVADQEGYFAPYAAVDMSIIYFDRNDVNGALKVLNAHTSLYDPERTEPSQVAVAYNNRCYAYMELGDLEKALHDCTQSLNFGSIPDAFRKQQELVARLNPSKAPARTVQ